MKRISMFLLLNWLSLPVLAEQDNRLVLEHLHDIPAIRGGMTMTMTMKHDERDLPYLYVASKKGGLAIYDLKKSPILVNSIPLTKLQSLEVMSVSQSGRFVYLALGNTFAQAKQSSGLAVVDVADPSKPRVTSVWSDPHATSGGGIIQCVGDHAYLGAMKEGLKILNVADKTKVRLLGSFVPDIHFPDEKVDPKKVNARGLDVRGNLVYLCYDAGGFRIIDVSKKERPREVGRYSNPAMNRKPRAYKSHAIANIRRN